MKMPYKAFCKKSAVWVMAFVLSAFGLRADVVITTLHSFQSPAFGSAPSTLLLGRDGNFYGTTGGGGTATDSLGNDPRRFYRIAVLPQ